MADDCRDGHDWRGPQLGICARADCGACALDEPAPPDDCGCIYGMTADGQTKVRTCRACLGAIEEDQVGDLRREVDGG